ncbi:MAG TPA: hypothetical protein VIE16_05675 [Phenylobacterium sp.]|jgi:hypothetical protein
MDRSQTYAAPPGLLARLPWRTERRDTRAVARLLDCAELAPATALRVEVEAMFCQRVSECRDFFTLRGVRPRRPTVLQMAGRSLAADHQQIERLDRLAPGMGFALLRALSQLIETWARGAKLALV